jgi:hypothetical protein
MKIKILNQEEANKIADRAKGNGPNGQKIVDALKSDAAKGQLKLIATMKRATASGFHNALAVLVQPRTASKTYDYLLKSNMQSLEKISEPGSVIGTKISLPCGPAIRVQSNKIRPGAATTFGNTYLIIHGNLLFVFSFVSHLADKEDWSATARSAMDSLKFER